MKLKWGWTEDREKVLMYSIDGGATWHVVGSDPEPESSGFLEGFRQAAAEDNESEAKPKRARKRSHR